MKKCPYCAEEIQDEAVICRYCHSNLDVKTDTQSQSKEKRAQSQINSKNLGGLNIKKYMGVILNLVALLGLFIPCFVIPALNNISKGLTEWGVETHINSLSPVSYISLSEILASIKDYIPSEHYSSIVFGFCLVYILFAILEIITVVFFVLSIKELINNITDSLKRSRSSIVFLSIIHSLSLLAVLMHNNYFIMRNLTNDTIDNMKRNGLDSLYPFSEQLKMDFPIAVLIFLLADIVFIVILTKLIKTIEKDEITKGNEIKKNRVWICANCGHNNLESATICENCKTRKKIKTYILQ